MPKRSSKPKDVNQLARSIIDQVTGQDPPLTDAAPPEKNPAAVALGRLGGLKGGKARAERLTAAQRHEVASLAARARWKKSDPK